MNSWPIKGGKKPANDRSNGKLHTRKMKSMFSRNKRIHAAAFLVFLVSHPLSMAVDKPAPLFPAVLVCYNGRIDSGSHCSTTLARVDGNANVPKGKLICGHAGAVSEITWTFLGQKDGKDLYHFNRKFPSDAADSKTSEADIVFDNSKRQIIFEDKAQCITIEPKPDPKGTP